MNVYVVRAVDHGSIKIGKAVDPKARVSDLQIGCPLKLQMVTTISCKSNAVALVVEAIGHDCLEPYSVRGEWFRPPDDVLKSTIELMLACGTGEKIEPTSHQKSMIELSIRNSHRRHKKRWKARQKRLLNQR